MDELRIKVFLVITDVWGMSNVAEIAMAAQVVSAERLAQTMEKAGVAVLKKNLDVEAQLQMEMVAMINDVQPHLGTQVDTLA